ncbi:Ig-like domain-containing protein [Brumimicrobium mesophilum]|uniref:Ig-like domain-containing protein n=1 Tax=Brumimicrobium mesophilum TaxID=392717 RepID=UPI000D1433DF|nr:Ig-like domain-containing protein [Brumimicrobium mesophilum]
MKGIVLKNWLLLLLIVNVVSVNAQNNISTLPKNQIVPLVNDGTNFTSVGVSSSQDWSIIGGYYDEFSNKGRAVDADLTNYTSTNVNSFLTITSPIDIPAGSFAGARIRTSSLLGTVTSLLGGLDDIVIKTLDANDNVLETYEPGNDNSSIELLSLAQIRNVGFVTGQAFRKIRIEYSASILSGLRVYYPFIKVYSDNVAPLACNAQTPVIAPNYALEVDDVGVSGVSISVLGSSILNPENVIDANSTNHATLNAGTVGVTALGTSYLSVKKQLAYDDSDGILDPFPAGTYAGFNITLSDLANVGLLDNITIITYLDDVQQEISTSSTNLVDVALLGAATQNKGFVTTLPYNEIRIVANAELASVSLGELQVNYPIIKKYCSYDVATGGVLDCNTQTPWTNTDYPVEVHTPNSSGLIAAGTSVLGLENIINPGAIDVDGDNIGDDYAQLGLNVSALSVFEIGVYDVLDSYTSSHFVGFDIETASLLDVNLLNNITISTYLNGVATGESVTGTSSLVNAPLLSGSISQTIGFVTSDEFDEVRIKFNSTVNANLGSIKIYGSVIKKMCPITLACNSSYSLSSPDFSAYIDFSQTGISGLACVDCNVENVNNVLTANQNDYAVLDLAVGVIGSASIAVRDATNSFPPGSTAGFNIEYESSILSIDLFDAITISTLDANGSVLESKSGTDLLGLGLLGGTFSGTTGTGFTNIGFETSQTYHGIKITVEKLLGADLGGILANSEIKVYGAFVDTRNATGGIFDACPVPCSNIPVLGLITQPTCAIATGSLQLTNFDASHTYVFSPSIPSANISSTGLVTLPVGTYTYTVNDGSCVSSSSANIEVLSPTSNLSLNSTQVNVTCLGGNTGSIDLTVSGGQPNYTYNWTTSNGSGLNSSAEDQSGLTAGKYYITVTDANTCTIQDSVIITESSPFAISVTGTNTNVSSNDNGTATASISSGSSTYSYLWSPGGETTPTITGLSPGNYVVTVTDLGGCEVTDSIEIENGLQITIPCNTDNFVPITSENFNDLTVLTSTSGVCLGLLGCGIYNSNNIINTDQTDFGSASLGLSLAATHTVRVSDLTPGEFFKGGSYAGFVISNNSLVSLDLLSVTTIRTYLNGVLQETSSSSSLLGVSTTLLGSGQFNVGFYTTLDFDAIEISLGSTVGLDLTGATNIFYAVTNSFCEGPDFQDPQFCNTPTYLAKPTFPARIVAERTGTSGISVATVTNPTHMVDSDPLTYAEINFLAGLLGGSASISVKDELSSYPSGTFVGFDLETVSTLGVDLLGQISITTYLNGIQVENVSNASALLGVGSGLLTGSETTRVGFVTSSAFDEVQLTVSGSVTVDLGSTKVYGLILQRFCDGPIECSEDFVVSNPTYPVIINNALTGVEGVACVGCEVDNSQNVISQSPTDFASINVLAGVAGTASVSVQNILNTYPAGTVAGFVIRDLGSILELDLLNSMTVSTYLDGVQQESYSGGSGLLSLNVLGILNINPDPNGAYAFAFPSSLPFNEVRLTVGSLVGVINSIEVYGQYINISATGICSSPFNNDFNVGILNDSISGDLSTNDSAPAGTTYGSIVDNGSNPSTDLPVLNSDGTYTFITDTVGVYEFLADACLPGVTSPNCNQTTLTITVTNPTLSSNPPIVNPDIATVIEGTPLTVNVLSNDGPGNLGGTLGNPTVVGAPSNGTTTIDGNGNVVYTPNTGFVGADTLTYEVCETPGNLCATATVTITVLPAGSDNTTIANDDYTSTAYNTAASGNAISNDTDPEGNSQSATPETVVLPEGTFEIDAAGDWTFTPNATYLGGTVNISYEVCDDGTPIACSNATIHVVVENPEMTINHDFNVGMLNDTITGDVSTNDSIPNGTTYSNPVANGSNPNTNLPVLNTDGTYTFVTDVAGVYEFEIDVCAPGLVSPDCDVTTLTLTITDPTISTNPPIVNPDMAVVIAGNPVTINVVINDGPGNTGGVLGTPTVVGIPTNGTTTVDVNGNVVYTPNTGFTGTDTFTYELCETPSNLCGSATVTVEVFPIDTRIKNRTIAIDDYASTPYNTVVNGNALANDVDPENDSQVATAQTITLTEGSFTIDAAGDWTFTPNASYIGGTVNIPYEVCDDGTPMACASGTIHVLVGNPPTIPDFKPTIFTSNLNIIGGTGVIDFRVLIGEYLNVNSNGVSNVELIILKNPLLNISFNNMLTTFQGMPVNNSDWVFDDTNPALYKFTYVGNNTIFQKNSGEFIGINATYNPASNSEGFFPLKVTIKYLSGGETNTINNDDIDYIQYNNN